MIHSTCNDLVEALRRSGACVLRHARARYVPHSPASATVPTHACCAGLDIAPAPDAPTVHVAHARQLATDSFAKWDKMLPPGRVRQEERRAIRDLLLLKVHMIDTHAQRTMVRCALMFSARGVTARPAADRTHASALNVCHTDARCG